MATGKLLTLGLELTGDEDVVTVTAEVNDDDPNNPATTLTFTHNLVEDDPLAEHILSAAGFDSFT